MWPTGHTGQGTAGFGVHSAGFGVCPVGFGVFTPALQSCVEPVFPGHVLIPPFLYGNIYSAP